MKVSNGVCIFLVSLSFIGGEQLTGADNVDHTVDRRATTAFFDDFNSGHLDKHHWRLDAHGAGLGEEFQMYTPFPENAYVKNGKLYIRPTLTTNHFGADFLSHGTLDPIQEWGYCAPSWADCSPKRGWNQIHPIMSAMLRTNATIKYGRVEVRAQLPKGDWLWPAIWLMPMEPRQYHGHGWPSSGEFDIMEAAGNERLFLHDGSSRGIDMFGNNMHYGPGGGQDAKHGHFFRINGTTFGDAFHTYWLDWTANHVRMGVDSHTVLNMNTPAHGYWQEGGFTGTNIWRDGGTDAPFDKPFYLILNVAVGGGFFNPNYRNEPYPRPWDKDSNTKMMEFWQARHLWQPTWHGEDVAMKVDWVRMRQY